MGIGVHIEDENSATKALISSEPNNGFCNAQDYGSTSCSKSELRKRRYAKKPYTG